VTAWEQDILLLSAVSWDRCRPTHRPKRHQSMRRNRPLRPWESHCDRRRQISAGAAGLQKHRGRSPCQTLCFQSPLYVEMCRSRGEARIATTRGAINEIAHAGSEGRRAVSLAAFVNSVSDVNRHGCHETRPTEWERSRIRQASDEIPCGRVRQSWFKECIKRLGKEIRPGQKRNSGQ
jgi:hypothetical protein